jgi:hypothetical protein
MIPINPEKKSYPSKNTEEGQDKLVLDEITETGKTITQIKEILELIKKLPQEPSSSACKKIYGKLIKFIGMKHGSDPKLKEKIESALSILNQTLFKRFESTFSQIQSQKKPLSSEELDILNYLATSPNKEFSLKIRRYLLENLRLLLNYNIADSYLYSLYLTFFNLTNEGGNKVLELREILIKMYEDKNITKTQFSILIAELHDLGTAQKEFAKSLIRYFLEKHGLPFRKIYTAWLDNAQTGSCEDEGKTIKITEKEQKENLTLVISKNILSLHLLEESEKGAAKFLHEFFGIRNFGRFTSETWLDQYKEKNRQNQYGIVVVSESDWNSSSYNEGHLKAYEELRKGVHPTHSLRILEAESLPELAKFLLRIKRKYKVAPSFVVWSGHMDSKRGEFVLGKNSYGEKNYKFFIAKTDFMDEGRKRMMPYFNSFSPETIMILDTCHENNEVSNNNFPTIMANTAGNEFIYPDKKTSVKDFGITRDRKQLSFNVKYNYGAKTLSTKTK